MAAPESSCSSRNLVPDVPMSPLGGRIGQGTVHESHASASDGSNTPPAAVLKSHSIIPSNAAVAIKSTLPRIASSTSSMQSSWIQRLKPFSGTCILEKEPANFAKKENPVCTHFTKDFRSCSRRLDKSSHHMRSSSWPPHGAWLEGEGRTSLEPGEAADIMEEYDKGVVNLGHQNVRFASKNITFSIDSGSGTGNLFAQQQNSSKLISALQGSVLCARNREISSLGKPNELHGSKNGGDIKPKTRIVQQFASRIKHLNKVGTVAACDVFQQMKPFIQPEEVCNKWDYHNDASASVRGDVHSHVLSVSAYRAPHSSGASADADDRNFFQKPLDLRMINKKELLEPPLSKTDCERAFSTDRFVEDMLFRREVDAEDLGRRNFKQFKEAAKISHLFDGFSNVRASRTLDCSDRNHRHLVDAFNKVHEGDFITSCVINSHTIPTLATLKQETVSTKLDAFCPRENNLANTDLSEGGPIRRSSFPIGALNEDAARSRIREISLGEYWNSWVRELEESDYVRPPEMSSSTGSLHQDFVVGENKKTLFQLPSSKLRLIARQELEVHHRCSPPKFAEDDAEDLGSCDFPQPLLASSSNNYHKFSGHTISSNQTKTGQGQALCASADRISHFRLKYPQDSQEEELCFYKGTKGRVDSQPHNEDSGLHTKGLDNGMSHSRMHSIHPSHEYCNNEGTGKGCNMHQAWIQRWNCSAGMSGKASAFLPGVSSWGSSSEQLVKLPESCSASAQCTLASSHRARGLDMANSGGGSNRCTEASGTHLDSCSASTPGSLPAVRNFAAFRSGYRVIACKSASKLQPTSLQNRGFCGLPCSSPKSLKCKGLPEDIQGTNDKKSHFVELDDLKDLTRHVDGS